MPKTVQEILNALENSEHLAWILAATDEQLDEYILKTSGNEVLHRAALSERMRRQFNRLSKPHWTLTPTFWISLGILIVSVAILIVTVLR